MRSRAFIGLFGVAAPCSFATAILSDDLVVITLSTIAGICYTVVFAHRCVQVYAKK